MDIVLLGILLVFCAGFVSLFFKNKLKSLIFFWLLNIGSAIAGGGAVWGMLTGPRTGVSLPLTDSFGFITLSMDAVSAFFVLIFSFGSIFASTFSWSTIKSKSVSERQLFACLYSLLLSSLLVIPLLQSVISFLFAWEIMSLSSAMFIMFEYKKEDVRQVIVHYLVSMHIGILLLIFGFLLLNGPNGNLEFSQIVALQSTNYARFVCGLVFVFLGFGVKIGMVPLNSWMFKMYSVLPTSIIGLVSGVMLNIGMYGILRMLILLPKFEYWMAYFFLIIGTITALLTIVQAIMQSDVKKILAYSSSENMGLVLIALGLAIFGVLTANFFMATLGFAAALVHILNHTLLKGLLFMGTSVACDYAGTRNIEELGAIAKDLKPVSAAMLCASLGIAGLPPFNGFIGKFLIFLALLNGAQNADKKSLLVVLLCVGAMSLISALTLMCFVRFFGIAFLGAKRSKNTFGLDYDLRLPNIVLLSIVAITLVLGVFPVLSTGIVSEPLSVLLAQKFLTSTPASVNFMEIFLPVTMVTLMLSSLVLILYFWRKSMLARQGMQKYKTWDCGYQAGTSKMQYSGFSFSESLYVLFKPLTNVGISVVKPGKIFSHKVHADVVPKDFWEEAVQHPVIKKLKRVLMMFTVIQSGQTQRYILLGLVFLVLALLFVMGYSL